MSESKLLAALREIANAGCKFDHAGKHSQWVVDIARLAIREHAEGAESPCPVCHGADSKCGWIPSAPDSAQGQAVASPDHDCCGYPHCGCVWL